MFGKKKKKKTEELKKEQEEALEETKEIESTKKKPQETQIPEELKENIDYFSKNYNGLFPARPQVEQDLLFGVLVELREVNKALAELKEVIKEVSEE